MAGREDSGRGLALDGRWLCSTRRGRHVRWLAPWLQVVIAWAWNLTVLGATSWYGRWAALAVGVFVLAVTVPLQLVVGVGLVVVALAWVVAAAPPADQRRLVR